jgi:hypothetical protein
MIGDGIHEEVLRALVAQHVSREPLVAKINGAHLGTVDPPSGAAAHAGCRYARGVSDCAPGPP